MRLVKNPEGTPDIWQCPSRQSTCPADRTHGRRAAQTEVARPASPIFVVAGGGGGTRGRAHTRGAAVHVRGGACSARGANGTRGGSGKKPAWAGEAGGRVVPGGAWDARQTQWLLPIGLEEARQTPRTLVIRRLRICIQADRKRSVAIRCGLSTSRHAHEAVRLVTVWLHVAVRAGRAHILQSRAENRACTRSRSRRRTNFSSRIYRRARLTVLRASAAVLVRSAGHSLSIRRVESHRRNRRQ